MTRTLLHHKIPPEKLLSSSAIVDGTQQAEVVGMIAPATAYGPNMIDLQSSSPVTTPAAVPNKATLGFIFLKYLVTHRSWNIHPCSLGSLCTGAG